MLSGDNRRKGPTRGAATVALLGACLSLGVAQRGFAAEAGTRSTPDGHQVLISKDVGGERWAMNLDLNSGTLTGNVFFPDGSPPKFVWCERTGTDGSLDPVSGEIRYRCKGGETCAQAPCADSGWSDLGEVSLPGSFFLPATDPFSPLREPDHYCSDACYFEEDIGGEQSLTVKSACCNYVTLAQPALRQVRRGDDLVIRLWHFQLTGPSKAEAYTAIQMGERLVWDARLPFPCRGGIIGAVPGGDCPDASRPADADPSQFEADFDLPAGASIYLHIQNHGENSYNMVEISVNGRPLVAADEWRAVSKGLRVRPGTRPASGLGTAR